MLPDSRHSSKPPVPLGVLPADACLNGGLKHDGLHEVFASQSALPGSVLPFSLLFAWLKQRRDRRPLIWIRIAKAGGFSRRHGALPYRPGLFELGIDTAAITLLHLPDAKAVLQAGLDSVRDGSASAVLIELHGQQRLLDLTASRRLALAAAQTGTMALLARSGTDPSPSAAHTRWQVRSAPSLPLAANAPGHPAFDLTLLRHRGGREGLHIIVEWDRDSASFKEQGKRADAAPLSGAVSAVVGGRAGDTVRDRAA